MDYIITENLRDFEKCFEIFKSNKNIKLDLIDGNQLLSIIT